MVTILLAIGIIALFFVGLSVRLLLLKNGEFRGTCATQNPLLMKKGVDCACGKKVGECQTGEPKDFPAIREIAR
jgi:hypothetical protein